MKIAHLELPRIRFLMKRLSSYMGNVAPKVGKSKIRLTIGYCFNVLRYGCTPQQYVLYRFYQLNHGGKKQFVTSIPQKRYEHKHSNAQIESIVNSKEKTLMAFSEYVRRDWCGVNAHNELQDFESFLRKHERGIMKPLDDYGGHGIEILTLKDYDAAGLQELCRKKNMLIESLIEQHPDLSQLNSSSVNTIRVVTNNGQILGAALRIGVGSACVDNASSGGIYAEVDVETGAVISKAINAVCDSFTLHPDTGVVIPGFVVPHWAECLEMVAVAAKKLPEVSLLGWDVAVCEDGPTLVEVNGYPMMELIQAPRCHGVAPMIAGY